MVDLASDFLDRNTPVFRDDVCFFISQSGKCVVGHSCYCRYNFIHCIVKEVLNNKAWLPALRPQRNVHNARNANNARFYTKSAMYARSGQ